MTQRDRKAATEPSEDMFRQHKPCSDCPFRKEGGVRHGVDRTLAYASYFTVFPGATFPCHQSVPKDDDRQGWSAWRAGQTLCAGGLIFAEKLTRTDESAVAAPDAGENAEYVET